MFQISEVTLFLTEICLISLKFYSLSKFFKKKRHLKEGIVSRWIFKFHWSQENSMCSPRLSSAWLPPQWSHPSHHQLEWHRAAQLHTAAHPSPCQSNSCPRSNLVQDCWTFLILLQTKVWFLPLRQSALIISPLLSTAELLPSKTRGRHRDSEHTVIVYITETLRK